jgi:hypothetical protein
LITLNEKLATYGQWTYRAAWTMEVVAAGLGLATGLALAYQAYSESFGTTVSITTVDLVLASAPFFMVALAELTKIPVATLLFSTSWKWKPILFVFLAALAVITFETVFLGLERAATQRQLAYERIMQKMQVQEAKKAGLEDFINRAISSDEVANAQEQLDKLRAQADGEFDRVRKEMVRLDEETLSPVKNNPEYAGINLQIEQLSADRDKLVGERDREVQQATEGFERQRESYTKRINDAQTAGDAALADRYIKELGQLKNPRNAIVQRYEPRITGLDAQIAEQRGRLRELLKTNSSISDTTRARVESRRKELERQLAALEAQWAPRLDAAREALASSQTTAAGKQYDIEKVRKELDGVGVSLAELEQERIPMARNDQVRRLAGRIYGARPEDVTTEQESFISLLWFGSLAALAALAGPIVATVALGLQRVAEYRQTQTEGKLSRLIRRMLLRWRFRRTRKVEVKVEVPVEREVEKRIEVPVDRVVKEILYVPILTDDPDMLRKTLAQDLPPEVAELVKVGMKGQSSGSPA